MLPTMEQQLVARLTKEREVRKMSKTDLAAAAGISRRALTMIEAGGDCTLSTLSKLYGVLGLEMVPRRAQRLTLDEVVAESEEELFGDRSAPGG